MEIQGYLPIYHSTDDKRIQAYLHKNALTHNLNTGRSYERQRPSNVLRPNSVIKKKTKLSDVISEYGGVREFIKDGAGLLFFCATIYALVVMVAA